MSSRKRNKILNYLSFVIITAISIFYINEVNKQLMAWQLIIPWALAAVFLIMWRFKRKSIIKRNKFHKSKIKRYI